ncbi:hypothetical protein AB1Y20_020001 [Prymnesium parvum]|uniref:Uncharacterized protein n=1 Tax=Prymnesium parvum TaxID=97485 RepID=A0AB34JXI0_PRYPA
MGGKGEKGGKSKPKMATPKEDDDALLDAAIAENLRIKEQQPPEVPSSENKAQGAALSREEIVRKLNAVPTFCLANADKSIVGIENPKGGEMCCWFLDPAEARAWLATAIKENPDVRGLHLGVTPLGIAYSFAVEWAPVQFIGELRLQGNQAIVEQMAPKLCEQIRAQGMDPGPWQLPVFLCDELQSPDLLPVFFSRATLVEAWVESGRSKETVPANLSVIDLRVLVAQMQTDAFSWRTLTFVGSADSVALVHEAKELSRKVMERQAHESDMPPPLEDDSPAEQVPELTSDGEQAAAEEGFVKVDVPPTPSNPSVSEAPLKPFNPSIAEETSNPVCK